MDIKPTREFYDLFTYIFDYYNNHLFENSLDSPMIIITRSKNVFGHYSHKRWINPSKEKVDEIAINPQMFYSFPLMEICQTIVHEMVHQWQFHYGKPSRTGYHNKEWSEKMIEIGLMPSSTGKEGGKSVGQKMADYTLIGGRFLEVTEPLINQNIFSKLYYEAVSNSNISVEQDLVESKPVKLGLQEKSKGKIKYICRICDLNIWGKQGMKIICGECKSNFEENTNSINQKLT